MPSFTISSLLSIERNFLWKDIWSFKGINSELSPLIRVSTPDIPLEETAIKDIPLDQHIFTSCVFLFKVIPIDVHYFKIKAIVENVRFEESSSSLLMKTWNHTRILEVKNEKTLLTDKIFFQHRIGLLERVTYPIYKRIFIHRHQYLQSKYNG